MTIPAYADLDSIQRPSTGTIGLPAWPDQVNDNSKHLYYLTEELLSVYSATTSALITLNPAKMYRQLGYEESTSAAAYSGLGADYYQLGVVFPVDFPNGCDFVMASGALIGGGIATIVPTTPLPGYFTTGFTVAFGPITGSMTGVPVSFAWEAIGH